MAGKEREGKLAKKSPPTLRPSASILLVSPANQVLLLHRVQTSTSFASAHVFPGGNLSSFHDGTLPASNSFQVHEDGPAYRLAAIRETFEESGIVLAKKAGQTREQGGLLQLSDDLREDGRKRVHANEVKFEEWVREQGGEPDVDNLIPFTRWITPHGPPKRFTTQMYLYMLPLSSPSTTTASSGSVQQQPRELVIPTPTHDGGVEHTAAAFDHASTWLTRARAGEIILFPPQFYLLHLVSGFLDSTTPTSASPSQQEQHHQTARTSLLNFLAHTPTSSSSPSTSTTTNHPTASIPWAQKVISPAVLFMRSSDGRVVLGLDKPGPELRGSDPATKGGDMERVVLVKFQGGKLGAAGPRDVEVRWRGEVLEEERKDQEEEERAEGGESSKL